MFGRYLSFNAMHGKRIFILNVLRESLEKICTGLLTLCETRAAYNSARFFITFSFNVLRELFLSN